MMRLPAVVGVEPGDRVAGRGSHACIARAGGSPIRGKADYARSRALGDLRRLIARRIVDHDRLERRARLRAHGRECLSDHGGTIEHGNDNGDGDHNRSRGAFVIVHAGARNAGMRAAAGDAIAWLDSDDCWEPHHLATLAALLEENPGAAAAGSAVRLVGARSGIWKGRIPEGPPAIVIREAFTDWLTPTTSTMVRRDALLAVGGFDESERYSEDFDLWLRLARRFRFVASREATARVRWHDEQLSASRERQWSAAYESRYRAIEAIRREGDSALADELAELFRARWARDVQAAWDEENGAWLRELLRLSALVPELPAAQRRRWKFRSRIPSSARPFFRAARRLVREASHTAKSAQ
jgi:hypothetical protein